MSADRYLAIVRPYSSMSYRNQTNTLFVILIFWLTILVVNLPHLFLWILYEYTFVSSQTRTVCILKYNVIKLNEINETSIYNDAALKIRAYYLVFNLFAYVIPFVSIFVLYGLIVTNLRKNTGQQVSKYKRKVTCMVIAVIACFVLCWGPLHIMLFIQHVLSKDLNRTEVIILVISNGIGYLNSCLNPIIYGFSNNEFKR